MEEYEVVVVRSDDAAKWEGRNGWERDDTQVTLKRKTNACVDCGAKVFQRGANPVSWSHMGQMDRDHEARVIDG